MSILDTIVARKREEVNQARTMVSIAQLADSIAAAGIPRGFVNSLHKQAGEAPAIIAEVKRGSPSLGCIRPDMDCVNQAKAYNDGGAACLSVLTDHDFFFAHINDFGDIRTAISLPMLRKDFMIDDYQIFQSRAMGADCILLIMACLEDSLASDLAHRAHELGMDVLCEAHNEQEVTRALEHVDFDLIGINNRNLKTFDTSWQRTLDLAKLVPDRSKLVAESGLHHAETIQALWDEGVKLFLIGEALVKAEDPRAKLRELMLQTP